MTNDYHNRPNQAEAGTLGADENRLHTQWRDRRAVAKATAAAELVSVRKSVIWRATHASRSAAIATGAARYTGSNCKRDPSHGGERYVSGGGCVACAREHADHIRRERGAPIQGSRPAARHPMRSGRRQMARQRRAEEGRR